ncbi:hypothetical protein [Vibrio azureus]|nr:hypothetical protein [Vibrio azureus]
MKSYLVVIWWYWLAGSLAYAVSDTSAKDKRPFINRHGQGRSRL